MRIEVTCQGCDEPLDVVDADSPLVPTRLRVRPCRVCDGELEEMLRAQREWQIQGMETRDSRVPTYTFIDPAEPPDERTAMEYLTYNVLALQAELHELLNETGWKPWATSNHVNNAALGEWVDAWHFMMNILWVVAGRGALGDAKVLAMTVAAAYARKRGVNIARQRNDYDGVTGKCRRCHRDLAETRCTPNWCAHYSESQPKEYNT